MTTAGRLRAPFGQLDSAAWLALDAESQSPYPPPLVLGGGQGCVVWDVDGRRFLDFESGQFCMSTGHAHPHVAAAIAERRRS
jgi:4-aminobutyrate aminotransferase-like enzyme